MKPLLRVLAVVLLGLVGFRLELPGEARDRPPWLIPPELSGHGPRLERAAARARMARSRDPAEQLWVALLAARSFCSEGRDARCAELAREVLDAVPPGDPLFLHGLEVEARALSDGGRPGEAAELLRPALAGSRSRDPALDARLRLVLGKALLRASDPAQALDVYASLERSAEAPLEARFEAGLRAAQALRALGRFDEARAVQERALALPVADAPRRALLAEIGILDDLEGRP